MATQAEIKAKVIEITNRPDLSAETDSVLARSLMAVHLASDFYFDVVDVTNPADFVLSALLQQTIALPARFRSVKYARTSYANGCNGVLTYLPSSALFGNNYLSQTDCYWRTGQGISFRFTSVPSALVLGYYRLPLFADSWIALNLPDAIIHHAAAGVFTLMKNKNMKDTYTELWNGDFRTLLQLGFDA